MTEQLNKRQLQHQTTLEALRVAVDELVEEVGFDKMTIRDICGRVGITAGAFYHYFDSKNDLLFDRYKRANSYLNRLFEQELSDINEVDALKRVMEMVILYTKSRVMGVLTPYLKAGLDDYNKWCAAEPDAFLTIVSYLTDKGLRNGTISPEYTREEIISALLALHNGAPFAQSHTNGVFLQDDAFARQCSRWIETFRAY